MKQFEVPEFYRSPIISKVKAKRKLEDPRKKDFSPTEINFGKITFLIARHFGFCYGVENAIEKSYKAIQENPEKRIFLLSQMIHNADVNADLLSYGLQFLQDTEGKQLIPFETLTPEDIVIIPAFGTTLEIETKLRAIGVNIDTYNTTCPFVEKVWNRSEKLGETEHTIIIHGKAKHEETRATFSHSASNAPALVIKDLHEAKFLGEVILGTKSTQEFFDFFKDKTTSNFNPELHLKKIGVVNQTTMLATETQEITDYLRNIMLEKYGEADIKSHIADTRDTLCYATNDNQSATYGLLENEADLAVVVGGYNSSNTSHLVELLEQKFPTFFIRSKDEIIDKNNIHSFDIHSHTVLNHTTFLPEKENIRVVISSGASCPDALVDGVIHKIINLVEPNIDISIFF
ncbi:MAG: 4-hydroxy-3-methylbut-2-enyl diphosphate reductase [Crocinitomicaceae bacterium]|nr:4-hydroxy-3-methylbut-2-enyl diphosphate reductase [Crocinitomicaceae bacterium]